jgi:hypothetical protein
MKDLFWTIVSEVSIHSHLDPLLWACSGEGPYHSDGSTELLSGGQIAERNIRKGPGPRYTLQRHTSSDPLPSLGNKVCKIPYQWKKAGCGGTHLSSPMMTRSIN